MTLMQRAPWHPAWRPSALALRAVLLLALLVGLLPAGAGHAAGPAAVIEIPAGHGVHAGHADRVATGRDDGHDTAPAPMPQHGSGSPMALCWMHCLAQAPAPTAPAAARPSPRPDPGLIPLATLDLPSRAEMPPRRPPRARG